MYTYKPRVIIYGTGSKCRQMIDIVFFNKIVEVIAFVDSDLCKQGCEFEGKAIISPFDINKYKYDYILIASVYFREIREKLINDCKVSANVIIEDAHNYLRNKSIKIRYEKLGQQQQNRKLNLKKIVIYTAMFGEYDDLIDPTFISNNCDYICFTDNHNIKSEIWKVIYINNNGITDFNRLAKEYKIMPHKFLKKYDYSIWVDANYKIKGDLRELLFYSENKNLAFLIHPDRNCIYNEAEWCKILKKDKNEIIDKQILKYRQEGYPANNGLICASCIIRKHNNKEVIDLMEMWWKEININSKRDQISFNYVAWKLNFDYNLIPINMYDNQFFNVLPHKK